MHRTLLLTTCVLSSLVAAIGYPVERSPMGGNDLASFLVRLVDEHPDLVVDGGRHVIGHFLATGVVPPQENL